MFITFLFSATRTILTLRCCTLNEAHCVTWTFSKGLWGVHFPQFQQQFKHLWSLKFTWHCIYKLLLFHATSVQTIYLHLFNLTRFNLKSGERNLQHSPFFFPQNSCSCMYYFHRSCKLKFCLWLEQYIKLLLEILLDDEALLQVENTELKFQRKTLLLNIVQTVYK